MRKNKIVYMKSKLNKKILFFILFKNVIYIYIYIYMKLNRLNEKFI